MKIIELLIDELEDLTGFDALALVKDPAIEAGFYAFANQDIEEAIKLNLIKLAVQDKFVTRLPGESKDAYIGRCIPVLRSEGYDEDQAAAICYAGLSEADDPYELEIYGYQTRHYDMCPGATNLYKKIIEGEIEVERQDLVKRNAALQDALFYIEKHVVKEMQSGTIEDVHTAEILAKEIMLLAKMMGLEEEHDYIQGHVDAIKEVVAKSLNIDVSSLPNYVDQLPKKKDNFDRVILPVNKTTILQAGQDERGLRVDNNEDKSYDVQYWWKDDSKPMAIEVELDGKSAGYAENIHLKFHPELDYKKDKFTIGYTDIPPGDLPLKRNGVTELRSYNDYPQAASNNAKRALKYADENGWGSCGTPVGKQRANQLAKREPISEDTIARMAAFERHRRNKNTPYGEGCGKLMWDAWGGDEGIAWAQRKLKQIRREENSKKTSLTKEKFFSDLSIEEQDKIFEHLENKGIQYSEVTKRYDVLKPEEFFKRCFVSTTTGLPIKKDATGANSVTIKGARVLYKYEGPYDSKNRTFCRRMMNLSKKGVMWSQQDLSSIVGSNPDFPPYNIFQYKGSHGCRHNWNKVYLYERVPEQKKDTKQKITVEFLSKASVKKAYKFNVDDEQMKVTGPLLIPNKLIHRFDQEGNMYYVYFSEETVKKIAEKMAKLKLTDKINLEHNDEDTVDGYMTESWFVEDTKGDKAFTQFGMEMPEGTWMGTYQIEDENVWNMIKRGDLTGFSIEGFFSDRLVQA